jgi:predicted Zn-dependent peptidase
VRVDKTLLPSGVRVVTESMPEVRSAALGFWVGSGSRDEPSDLQGSSHFLEHLLFKGTSSRTARDIAEAFDAVGGEANAFSEKEFTCLFGRVLDRDLPMASEVLSDMLLNPLLSPDDIEAERRVILEELAMLEDTPEDLVHDVFAEALFGEHPLGREIMGTDRKSVV